MIVAYRIVRRRIACPTARRGGNGPSPDRVPYGPSLDDISSRAISPVAGSRAVRRVACGIAGRWTRRQGWLSRAVWPVAGSRAVRPVAHSRLVVSLPVSAPSMSLPWSRLGEPNARRLPCPGPTAPVADAARSGLRTFILLHGRRALVWLVRRRG